MSQLVQISDLKNIQNAQEASKLHVFRWLKPRYSILDVANMARHPLLLELAEALSAMFGRIGMHEVCSRCFSGKLTPKEQALKGYEAQGCCGSCPLLGHNSCTNKPLLCASWMCHMTSKYWPVTYHQTMALTQRLREAGIRTGPYTDGIVEEHQMRLTLKQKLLLQRLIREVQTWNETKVLV